MGQSSWVETAKHHFNRPRLEYGYRPFDNYHFIGYLYRFISFS